MSTFPTQQGYIKASNRGLPHVVVVGSGSGGLAAVRKLSRERVRVTVIDRRNYHLFQPLLYQVATAALSPADIASAIRHVLRGCPNVSVMLGEASSINVSECIVNLRDGTEVGYDFLIIATGSVHSYFGHDEWAKAAPGLKNIEDATDIRRRFIVAFEAAERETDAEIQHKWMTFVVVGGGPTGVELAGALAESRRVLEREYRRIRPELLKVVLIEGAPRVLPAMSEASSADARRQLERLGVEVLTGTMVTAVDDAGVSCGVRRIDSETVIWAAGVAASPLGRTLGVPVDRVGRVKVNTDLSVPGARNAFVIGDLAAFESDGKSVPGLAPAAMQEGRHAARNVMRTIRGEPLRPFRYRDKGTLAIIGRGRAVADIGRIHLSGMIAWLAWLTIHLFYIMGFRNRFFVIAQWGWLYIRNVRSAPLITGDIETIPRTGRATKDPLESQGYRA
jgi:NADH:ubiquinone reductase (H+-translocating)